MSNLNQIANDIKEHIISPQPSSSRILTLLSQLRSNEAADVLNESDYYDIVGETFRLNPEFFMNSIYPRMRSIEMARYILEKYCLYRNEQIIYECRGDITQLSNSLTGNTNVKVSVIGGIIFITNYRIIAQGTLTVKGGRFYSGGLIDLVISPMTGGSSRKKGKQSVINDSLDQELPCYGYQFKSRGHIKLKKKSNSVNYLVIGAIQDLRNLSAFKQANILMKAVRKITITVPRSQVDELYGVLKKDINQVFDMFLELDDLGINGRMKRNEFLYRLRKPWNTEEYQNFTDSDYMYVVKSVYDLDPQFFIDSIYPKMETLKIPIFLRVKEQLSEILSNRAPKPIE